MQQKRKPPSRHVRGKSSTPSTNAVPATIPSVESSGESKGDTPAAANPLTAGATTPSSPQVRKPVAKDPFLDDSDDDDIFGSKPKSAPTAALTKATPPPSSSGSDSLQPPAAVKVGPDGAAGSVASLTPTSGMTLPSDPFSEGDDDNDSFTQPNSLPHEGLDNADITVDSQSNGTEMSDGESATDTSELSPPLRQEPPSMDDSPPPATSASKKSDAFVLDDSDDDMFSTKTKKSKQKAVVDTFDDDALFGSSKPAKKKAALVSVSCFHFGNFE